MWECIYGWGFARWEENTHLHTQTHHCDHTTIPSEVFHHLQHRLIQCLPPPPTPSTPRPCSLHAALPVKTTVRTKPPTPPGLRLTHHRLLRRNCVLWPQDQTLEFHGGAGRAERGAGCEPSLGDGWRILLESFGGDDVVLD
jgi:hypothetical protein